MVLTKMHLKTITRMRITTTAPTISVTTTTVAAAVVVTIITMPVAMRNRDSFGYAAVTSMGLYLLRFRLPSYSTLRRQDMQPSEALKFTDLA